MRQLRVIPNVAVEVKLDSLTFSAYPLTRGEQLLVVQLCRAGDMPKLEKGEDESEREFAVKVNAAVVANVPHENVDKLARFLATKIERIDGLPDDKIADYLLYGSSGIMELFSIGFKLLDLSRLSGSESKNSDCSSGMSSPAGTKELVQVDAGPDVAST